MLYPRSSPLQLASERALVGLTILRSSVLELEILKDAPGLLNAEEADSIKQLMKNLKAVELLILVVGIYADRAADDKRPG
jgi:hypothetical protein